MGDGPKTVDGARLNSSFGISGAAERDRAETRSAPGNQKVNFILCWISSLYPLYQFDFSFRMRK